MKKLWKKGADVGDLYQFVLLLVLVGMIVGVGLVVLSNFEAADGVNLNAGEAINSTIASIMPIASTWLPLIVTVTVLAIVLTIVIRSFAGQRR